MAGYVLSFEFEEQDGRILSNSIRMTLKSARVSEVTSNRSDITSRNTLASKLYSKISQDFLEARGRDTLGIGEGRSHMEGLEAFENMPDHSYPAYMRLLLLASLSRDSNCFNVVLVSKFARIISNLSALAGKRQVILS